jgi:hypothetical protein
MAGKNLPLRITAAKLPVKVPIRAYYSPLFFSWFGLYPVNRATKALMNIELSKFNVVNSRTACENTGII